ncbi:MAG: aminomethyl-transferring glycine dehydrogenase [Gemmatimonadaceae bacterium]
MTSFPTNLLPSMTAPTRPAAPALPPAAPLTDTFVRRHVGPSPADVQAMLGVLGYASVDQLIDATIPASIRLQRPLALPAGTSEHHALEGLRNVAAKNQLVRSFIGMGYYGCLTPPVIKRNVLENPGWYTAYTPYQAEIAQGRLEALLNFQTMVIDLTKLEIANASLLDESTAAAEAMAMVFAVKGGAERSIFLVAADCHPQTIDVVRTRASARGITVRLCETAAIQPSKDVFGVLLQYPATDGSVTDYRDLCERVKAAGGAVVVATDLLALTLLTPPGEWGADVAVGSSQRFGVPLGYGGPHAAFFATRDEFRRHLPGRIIGVSRDADGQPALRMALQTREQHIRREKATSNVCTSQVLLAVVASMYAVWHGPDGLLHIAKRIHRLACILADGLERLGFGTVHPVFFDTVRVDVGLERLEQTVAAARTHGITFRSIPPGTATISLDEATTLADVVELLRVFGGSSHADVEQLSVGVDSRFDERFARTSCFLTHSVFHSYHTETEMLRYMHRLESKDLSLTTSMIPLGSCTMKLNATAEMIPVTWPEFADIHPFAPREQTEGYREMFTRLEESLAEITGFSGVSLQPNAGSQGEYAGLLVIRRYHEAHGAGHRDICLIPQSAHGTNPASAVMAGMKVVVVKTDTRGNIDLDDLRRKALAHRDHLAALMITYPSTHGVFEGSIREVCALTHAHGAQVYMDGANMNAQVGLCRPGDIGADVCHLNLHKTFCIPHGGGGPGMGPIAVATHLRPYLPRHPLVAVGGDEGTGAVSAAPWGSAGILPISYMYIEMMGGDGLTEATKMAILNANYMAKRLEPHYPVLYRGEHGTVAHECIIDPRGLKSATGIDVEDIAKRLIDYGFHAPTVSFPVAGTLMIEPTESESKEEIDRFCDALISIRAEIRAVETGEWDRFDNPLKHAPHPMARVVASAWSHAYTRETAAFPTEWTREHKFWPSVARIDSAYGDRHLVCSCPPTDAYVEVTDSTLL